MRRPAAHHRQHAATQLRGWQASGELGIGDVAWSAVERAAVRYGYPDASSASHADPSVLRDLFSEAIEDLESER